MRVRIVEYALDGWQLSECCLVRSFDVWQTETTPA